MTQSGHYSTVFTWKKYTGTKNPSYGDDGKTFADNGKLWGSLDYTTGSIESEYGVEASKVRVQIKLRQWVSLVVNDRLHVDQFDEVVVIEGVRKGIDPPETIIDGYIYGSLRGV